MAHKKAGGSTRLGRDSQPQYLGVKVGDGQFVKSGAVITRQRGTRIHPGKNVKKGKDDTLFSTITGIVKFTQRKRRRFDGHLKPATFANVLPTVIKQSKQIRQNKRIKPVPALQDTPDKRQNKQSEQIEKTVKN